MHEYPITLQIIKIAEKHAAEAGASHIKTIKLVVGDYSGFVGDSIKMYFDEISKGTACENAEIIFERVKPLVKCNLCGHTFERKLMSFDCPMENCRGQGEPTEIGKEFYISSIEVESD